MTSFRALLLVAIGTSLVGNTVLANSDDSVFTKRNLRADDTEEKTIKLTFDLSGLEKSASLAKAGVLKIDDMDWIKLKAKSDLAFKMLNLDEAGDKAFKSPQFKSWIGYMSSMSEKYPESAIMSTLATRYSDKTLVKMIEATKKLEGMEGIAKKMQDVQVKSWVQRGNTADDLFELLKLDRGMENLLNPKLDIFSGYLNLFNKYSKPGEETTLVSTFITYYGDEVVAKTIAAAKKVSSTKEKATELEMALFTQWFLDGAKPHQIWKMLRMEKSTWMRNPVANIWREYLAFYKLHK
ncbi:hypothetical protein P3T76_007816 [Phytophthora citrophthora]|uniref:RxLR effector protein n=1 Tax=Phytophthora citrophthora TaxID=4793 RepID=A0AAD9GM56_9STRA|nr:hypothetical protein P3T76_007816 [Phytophthora citrophthora]